MLWNRVPWKMNCQRDLERSVKQRVKKGLCTKHNFPARPARWHREERASPEVGSSESLLQRGIGKALAPFGLLELSFYFSLSLLGVFCLQSCRLAQLLG